MAGSMGPGPFSGGIGLVDGWRVGESAAYGWLLLNPDGFEVSPNMAPGLVRDAFRAFVDDRTSAAPAEEEA